MSALRTRLVEINARLGRATAWPWQSIRGGVIAPPVRVQLPRPGLEGLNIESGRLGRFDALDDIEYYGGELVCESCRTEDADLIANAPTDLAVLADTALLLLRDRDRLRFLMEKHGYSRGWSPRGRQAIDVEMKSLGHDLFELPIALLPRRSA